MDDLGEFLLTLRLGVFVWSRRRGADSGAEIRRRTERLLTA